MSMNNTVWKWYSFAEFNAGMLYQVLALRTEVFVVEQDCPYQDMDGLDQTAWHLCGMQGVELVAYLRLLAPGVKYAQPAIGRVIVSAGFRGHGLGREVMEQGMQATEDYYPGKGMRLSAQLYLQAFYASLGFKPEGDEYLEDNIPHIEMFK